VLRTVTKVKMILFIAVEGESQTVRGGWPVTMVQIQYFSFGSIGEAMG
jgi:hypothetical protein